MSRMLVKMKISFWLLVLVLSDVRYWTTRHNCLVLEQNTDDQATGLSWTFATRAI
jgi:hypothetical protein